MTLHDLQGETLYIIIEYRN